MERAFSMLKFRLGILVYRFFFPEKISVRGDKIYLSFYALSEFSGFFGYMVNTHRLNGIGVGRIRTFSFLPIPFTTSSLMIQPTNRKARNQTLLLLLFWFILPLLLETPT